MGFVEALPSIFRYNGTGVRTGALLLVLNALSLSYFGIVRRRLAVARPAATSS